MFRFPLLYIDIINPLYIFKNMYYTLKLKLIEDKL